MAITTHNTALGNGLAQPCSFADKEKDEETGFSYFGARYYDSDLSGLFLSIDPMADKYPSISPYAYCAWNPIRLVDPDGREVEYTSVMDWIRVSFQRIVNSDFQLRFNDLKASEETYVFNGYNGAGKKGGEFTTDGDKLYINYNTCRNDEQGTHSLVNLRHETEHAVQFEYGEVGFDRTNNIILPFSLPISLNYHFTSFFFLSLESKQLVYLHFNKTASHE